MTLVRTVFREIAQADDDVTPDDIVHSVIDKMCASGASQEACDDIRERLIGITLCALKVMAKPELVTEWAESVQDSPARHSSQGVMH